MISDGAGVPGSNPGKSAPAYKYKACGGMAFDSKKEFQAHNKKTRGGKK